MIYVLIIVVLILVNGFFALSEIALVSSKKNRLESDKKKGHKGAKMALQLQSKSEDFLLPKLKLIISTFFSIA